MRNLLHKWVSYVSIQWENYWSSIHPLPYFACALLGVVLLCRSLIGGPMGNLKYDGFYWKGILDIWWLLRLWLMYKNVVLWPYSILVVIWIICMKKNAKIFNDYLNWWIILGLDSFSNFSLGVNHQRVWRNSFSILLMAWVVFALED